MPNRLASETSPYLLQHKDNPVDWMPWGDEAFARAREEDKPVFLSVGYSSCHWCHVMEHESFEDESIAKLLNENFVSVKVDREERPDVDEAYMAAVQLTSGRGGWPMSVFMTPDKKPFFAGTYFPKNDVGQHPGFSSVVTQIANAWKVRRTELQQAGDQLAEALGEAMSAQPPEQGGTLDAAFMDLAFRTVAADFDQVNGGFGKAPKFPPHSTVEFLLLYALQPWALLELREMSLGMVAMTLEKMVLGGIHDHVGGGFHRYSTDEKWLLPHFEKMLYDNALMLGNLARSAGLIQQIDQRLSNLFIDAAQEIINWLEREMTAPEGWFYSAQDADSEGEEGKFYVWTAQEVRDVLGARADAVLGAYRIQAEGNFLDEATHQLTGNNIPHLANDAQAQFKEDLSKLRLARESRVHPGLDDKALVSWNGLMIGSLAESGMATMAERAALAILSVESQIGYLPHQIAKGKAGGEGYLEDFAALADGLLKLAAMAEMFEERGESRGTASDVWIQEAARLASVMVEKFYDPENGGFFSTSESHELLFGRSRPVFDQPIPSGNALALRVLVALGAEEPARQTAQAMLGWMHRAPQATEALLAACLPLIHSSAEVSPFKDEPAAAEPQPIQAAAVKATLSSRELRADADGMAVAIVTLDIPDGLHVNSNEPPARWLTPTRVDVKPVKATVTYPAPSNDQYEGQVEIQVAVQLPAGEDGAEFEVTVTYQPCTNTECLLPVEKRFDCVITR